MRSLIIFSFAALVACSHAKVHYRPKPPGYAAGHPDAAYYYPRPHHRGRHARDTTLERNARRGKVFVTLGSTDHLLFGRGGYRQDIFNDHRGRLQGEANRKRVLGAGGDIRVRGSKFNWHNANDNVRAGLHVHKEIGGGNRMKATGDGVWKLGHNSIFVVGGNLVKRHIPIVGIKEAVEHDF